MALEDDLGCFGYFGFGGGYARVKFGVPDDTTELYCSDGCGLRKSCWEAHRQRTRELFPEMTNLAEDVARTHRGDAYVQEWLRRTEQDAGNFVEPFCSVVAGNIEDGGRVAAGQDPKARGLRYRFTWSTHHSTTEK